MYVFIIRLHVFILAIFLRMLALMCVNKRLFAYEYTLIKLLHCTVATLFASCAGRCCARVSGPSITDTTFLDVPLLSAMHC